MIWRKVSASPASWGLCVGAFLLALVGCQVHSSGPAEVATVEVRTGAARIADEILEDHGLETVWFSPAGKIESPILRTSLLPEGLLVSTQPTAGKEGRLELIRRTDGHPIWFYRIDHVLTTDPTAFRYPPGSGDKHDELYLSQLDTLHIVDLRYGDLMNKEELPFPISTGIAAVDDLYFVGSDNGRVYGVSKSSHIEKWSYRTGGDLKASPAMGASSVLFASTDGSVYGFSPGAGWARGTSWKFDTGAPVVCDPVPYSQWVIVGSTDYKLYCLEERDGSVFWSFLAEAPIIDTPAVYSFRPGQDFVYCIAVEKTPRSEKRTLFAVKLRDGQMAWRRSGVRAVVSMGKDALYVINDPVSGEGRTLSALDVMDGKEKFRIDVGQFHFVPINLADHGRNQAERGRIYLVAKDGTIQVIGEKF